MTTEQLIHQFIQHLAVKDADAVGRLFADEIDWFVPGNPNLPWTGKRSSRDEVPDYFRTMWPRYVDGSSVVSIDLILVNGDDAVLFGSFRHILVENGRSLETAVAMRFKAQQGKLIMMHLFEDTAAVTNAFFG